MVSSLDARVVLVDLFRQRVVGREHIQQGGGGEAAHGELGRLVEELPALDDAVHVLVEQVQQFLVEITRLSALHDGLLVLKKWDEKMVGARRRSAGGIINCFEAMRPSKARVRMRRSRLREPGGRFLENLSRPRAQMRATAGEMRGCRKLFLDAESECTTLIFI